MIFHEPHGLRRLMGFGGFALLLAMVAMGAPQQALAQTKTFFIDESTDFSGNGCENTDLNDVTSSLRSRLASDGWSGSRFANVSAWPQDFFETTFAGLEGLDGSFGDTKLLTVYAGHGNRGLLQFGFKRKNRCIVRLNTDSRLGTAAGDKAAYAMYVTSCTINTDSLSLHFRNQIRQSFGYHNSPSVKDDQPRDFFEATSDLRNTRAWLEEMEDRPGWFTGDNSPIALTFGIDASHCSFVQSNAKLRAGSLLTVAPEPHTRFCFEMFDHGASGC